MNVNKITCLDCDITFFVESGKYDYDLVICPVCEDNMGVKHRGEIEIKEGE